MVFSSTVFLFAFLPVVLIGYYLIQKRFRNAFLLVMSLIFYAWGEPSFVVVMVISILVNYLVGLLIGKSEKQWLRRVALLVGIGVNMGILFYNKYFDFAIANINAVFHTGFALRRIVLPIGISFFTFQGMSYVFDVYLKKAAYQKNPLHVALYVALFPQLIAGPIVRYVDIEQQITQRQETLSDFKDGAVRFAVGLCKKIVLSNNAARLADLAFETETAQLGPGLAWLGALAYALQIYFDFSGYSDMAIGLGRMFGFRFLENFDYPYVATSVTVFWRKWHISLSSWFRDYVYIPLGGNRKGNVYLHLLIVFFLTGLWHGAQWNFVVWGLWHGGFLILERLNRKSGRLERIPSGVRWLYTMLVVLVGWVFFRAPGLKASLRYLGAMVGFGGRDSISTIYLLQDYAVTLILAAVCALPIVPQCKRLLESKAHGAQALDCIGMVAGALLLLVGIAYTVSSTYNPFIYFNF